MTSHLGLLILFSVFVSVIFAVLMRDDPKEQRLFGLRLFAGFVGAAIGLSWLLYFLPLQILSLSHQRPLPTQIGNTRSAPTALSLWLPVALYMAAIFAASSLSNPPVPSEVPDFSLHEAAYAGLTLVTIRALARGRWSRITAGVLAGAWTIAVIYGVTDEFHQSFVPERHAELRDLRSDAIGAFAAVIAVRAWGILFRL